MNWRWKQAGPVALLDLVYSDELSNANRLQQELVQRLEGGSRSVCARVTIAPGSVPDSILIAILIRIHKAVFDTGGELVLANPPKLLRSAIELMGLDKLLRIQEAEPAREVLSVRFQTEENGPESEATEVRLYDDGLSFRAPGPLKVGGMLTLLVERLAPDGVEIDVTEAEIIDARDSAAGGTRYSLKYR